MQKAQDDLKSDEEIFADREKEITSLKDLVNELNSKLMTANRCLEAAFSREKEQQELMLQLQIQLDNLMQNKASLNSEMSRKESEKQFSIKSSTPLGEQKANSLKQRATTAPLHTQSVANQNEVQVSFERFRFLIL